jgi:hypothetical protein
LPDIARNRNRAVGRRVTLRRGAAFGAVLAVALPGAGFAEPAPGDRGAFVLSLAAAPDGIYAVERRLRCERACERLVRTRDGGQTWAALPARGWAPGEVVAADVDGATVLLSPGGAGPQVSVDGGASFRTVTGPGATVETRGTTAFLGGADGGAATLDLRSLRVTSSSRLPVSNARVVPHPAYPAVPAGEPYALVSGTDPATGFPAVARCDARWRCSAPSVVVTREDMARAYVSPGFARDRTVVVTLARGGLYRSTDGGVTYAPEVVAPARANEVVASYPSVAFTPDFDAARGTGRVVAGAISVATGGGGALSGGVYASTSSGRWSRVGGAGPPDKGVTALALHPSGALYAGYFAPPSAGVVCLGDRRWSATCPAVAGRSGAGGANRTPGPAPDSGHQVRAGARPPVAGATMTPRTRADRAGSPAPPRDATRESRMPGAPAAALALAAAGVVLARRRVRRR